MDNASSPSLADLRVAHEHVGRCCGLLKEVWLTADTFAAVGPKVPGEVGEKFIQGFRDKSWELWQVAFSGYVIPDVVQRAFCSVGKAARLRGAAGPNGHACLEQLTRAALTELWTMLPEALQPGSATAETLVWMARHYAPLPVAELNALWAEAEREYLLAVDRLTAGTPKQPSDAADTGAEPPGLAEHAETAIEEVVQAIPAPPSTVPKSEESKAPPALTVEEWSDLAIGIEEERRYFAVTPAPECGAVFPVEKARELDLPGKQWEQLLDLLAQSEFGNAADKSAVMHKFGYLQGGGIAATDIEELQRDTAKMRELNTARTRLTSAVKDLARKLRGRVQGPKNDTLVLSVADAKVVRAEFVVRYLVRLPDGKLHFGEPRG